MRAKIGWILIAIVGVFFINNLAIDLLTPSLGGESSVDENALFDRIVKDDSVNIVAANTVEVNGAIGLNFEATGYVNVGEAAPNIYINSAEDGYYDTNTLAYILTHEYSHVLQKRLVAEVSGGYPNRWNPIQSAIYYYNFLRLNNELAANTPGLGENFTSVATFEHLETNADCLTQTEGLWLQEYSYIGFNYCKDNQLGAAYAVADGEWPTDENIQKYVALLNSGELDPYGADRSSLFAEKH